MDEAYKADPAIMRAMYFFDRAIDEINAIKQYLNPLSEPFIEQEDKERVLEKIDDEMNHCLGNLASSMQRLNIFPSEDELAENIAELCKGVKDKRSFFATVASLL